MIGLDVLTVPVDPANPGQFFACCGLLELAVRKWAGADILAHFNPDHFVLSLDSCGASVAALLTEFSTVQCEQLDPGDRAASALQLLEPFDLRLDWWWKPADPNSARADLGGAGYLKTWAGQQPGPLIFQLMRRAVAKAAAMVSPFDYAEPIFGTREGKTKAKTISPFYFDCRREGTSLDLGFSPDEQNMSVEAYPVVESLALVGLQRFRPYTGFNTRERFFVYTAWAEPLSATVATAAVCGAVSVRSCGRFRFTKPSRGGEYVSMFSRAKRERSKNA